MNNTLSEFNLNGFAVLQDVYTSDEINAIVDEISKADQSAQTFRRADDLFAIRQFLKEIPAVRPLIFTDKFKGIIKDFFGDEYFVVKSIYFDKPETSNWFVAWHQDLTISVDAKTNLHGYGPWTVKHNQYAVQPPIDILEDNFTIRIHLDDTDEGNGALKIIPGSHLKGIQRVDEMNYSNQQDVSCNVPSGGIMLMRPLLMHASNRTTTNKRRRVLHVEFSRVKLPEQLKWSEGLEIC